MVDIDPVVVAPRPAGPGARIEIVAEARGGDSTGSSGSHDGDVDGIRPWRDGDTERSVHWPTSLRTGDLVVLDRHRSADTRWIVRIDPDAGDSEESKRVVPGGRSTRAGGAVSGPRPRSAARHRSRSPTPMPRRGGPQRASRIRWRPGRASSRARRPEAGLPLAPTARWAAAAATFTALTLLVGAIGSSALTIALLAAGTAAGAAVTARVGRSGGELPTFVRTARRRSPRSAVWRSIAAGVGQRVGPARRPARAVAPVPHAARRAPRLRVHRPTYGDGFRSPSPPSSPATRPACASTASSAGGSLPGARAS